MPGDGGPQDSPASHWNEADRLAALARYDILDTEREAAFDELAALAADILDAPIAVVNLIADGRQWFKAEVGIGRRELPLDVSICRHAILQPGLFVVPDLADDPRFACNPLVEAAGGLRFYAGALLETPEGLPLGTVCVLDTRPRPGGLSERQARALRTLAAQAMAQIELRRSEALARSEGERFRALFETAGVGMVLMDRDCTIGAANAAFRDTVGRTEAELVGRSCLGLAHAEDAAEVGRIVGGVAEGREAGAAFETRCLGPDGGTIWVRLHVTPLGTGQLLAVVEDVTARKATEAALERSAETLRLATEGARLGTWDLDLRARRSAWSARAAEIWDLPEGIAGDGDYSGWRERVHPEDLRRLDAAFLPHVRGEVPDYAMEYRYRAADGGWRWVASAGRVVGRDPATGEAIRAAGVIEDITARKEAEAARDAAEAALRGLNEGLERRVREEVAAREEAQARLAQAQRMEALGQLSGGIAHDFNNVLQAVSGGARLIAAAPEDAARVRRLARMVGDAAGRGAAITRRLLAFSRRADLRAEPVDPAALLGDMREILVHTLGAGVEVRVQVAGAAPALLADKGGLETVLVNLAANARDAMGGAGAITLSAVAEAVPAGGGPPVALRPGTYVRLSVSDTGAGMDAATLARVGEPFFTTKAIGKGTGLGIAMARGFAEQSGGALHIESAPGAGTTVRLWLPVATDAPAAARAEPVAQVGDRPARVLLVDDEALVREITAEGLEAAGYAVLSFGSGREALETLDAGEAVDFLVSDLSMPGMDGLETIREAQRRRPGLPAILLTGFATDMAELAVGGAISGSFSLLRKPVEGRALADRVAVLLEGASARG